MKVFDLTGKEIETLLNENLHRGEYKVLFDASDLPSGVYFYSLYSNENLIGTKKLILLK